MLKQRVITAIVLALLAVLALFKSTDIVWQWVVLLIGAVMAWEWAGLARLTSIWQKATFSVLVSVLSWLGLVWISFQSIVVLTLIEALLLVFIVLRYQKSQGKNGPTSLVFILMTGVLSVVLFTSALTHFRNEFSPQVVLLSLFIIWAVDTGAYFSGKRFGKTKLAPHVSPGKTWEGVWGGVALAFVISLMGVMWLQVELTISIWFFTILLAAIALFSVLGDLFESVLKRQAGLKDSGTIFPGHGGILDRADSLLIAVPMMYVLWHLGSVY
ncbi:Phosphatidate cytidylyltransferase [hydrothermal vent metagenome]|uniref:Phosphatidate cytidylyltransferase n=1 Tax=hydrothermal vent metagenome TaxID=652676 RepID=A0A3B0WJ18_9ZZZZ